MKTSAERQRTRTARLNEAARKTGVPTWAQLETRVLRGEIEMITNQYETRDSYFDQVVEDHIEFSPESGLHAGHSCRYDETYHTCGSMEESEYCNTCQRTIWQNEMNGCDLWGHKRPEWCEAGHTPSFR